MAYYFQVQLLLLVHWRRRVHNFVMRFIYLMPLELQLCTKTQKEPLSLMPKLAHYGNVKQTNQNKTKIPRPKQLMNRFLFSVEWRNLVLLCKAHFMDAQYTILSFKLQSWVSTGEMNAAYQKSFFSIKLTDYNWSFLKWACLIICLITTEKEMEIKDLRAGSCKQIWSKVILYEMLI